MELLVKLHDNQTPRLGVCYASEYRAQKAYEGLTGIYLNETVIAGFEFVNGLLQLTLVPANGGVRTYYKALEYSPGQLLRLRRFVKSNDEIEFVHVYKKNNACFIAKPGYKKTEFIRLSGYQIHGTEGVG